MPIQRSSSSRTFFNFTKHLQRIMNVGDRCLVVQLQSDAGQLLNGQHVTIVKAINQNGRFKGRIKCKCADGSLKQIKPYNLRIIDDDRGNQNTKKHEKDQPSNQNKRTDNGDKKPIHEAEEKEVCPICTDALPSSYCQFSRYTCCGKGLHHKCAKDLMENTSMTLAQKNTCIMCRAKLVTKGSKEEIKRIRRFVKKGKGWAMEIWKCWVKCTVMV